jgi:hypothetical protein
MRNTHLKSQDVSESSPSSEPVIDYSPKTSTLRNQIVFGVKLSLVAVIFFLMLWLLERYVS